MSKARKILISLLLRAEKEGYSNLLLNSFFSKQQLEPTEKAFITATFYGVLERRLTLDYILNCFLKKPIHKAPPYTAAVLRSGAYQIFYMQKVPNSAAVNESVKLLRASKERGNAGLCNAVLRRLCTANLEELLQGADLSVRYSVAPWLAARLTAQYGAAAEEFLANTLCTPPVHIRLNTVLSPLEKTLEILRQNGVQTEPDGSNGCYRVQGLKGVEALQQKTGYGFFVQELASQLCAGFVQAAEGQRILDACAAPGGKSFCTALNVNNRAEIISCDLHAHRVGLIQKNAALLGLDCIQAVQQDATVFSKELGQFDRILCDVPCSGFGVMRRKPEIKYKEEALCAELPALQLQILTNVSRYLKPGGRLIYSTCTVLKEENEQVVQAFLKQNPQFKPAPLGGPFSTETSHTFLPPQTEADGFFVAAIVKK